MLILLNNIELVKRFVAKTTSLEMSDVDLKSGRYRVSSTSIMGIFSLDLTKPMELVEENMTSKQKEEIIKEFNSVITN